MNDHCPICGSSYVRPLLTTPYLPVSITDAASDPVASEKSPRASGYYHYCPTCTHVFNATFDSDLVDYEHEGCRMFNNGSAWQQHINSVQQYISNGHYDRVVEIGPGDGSFLAGVLADEKVVYEPSTDARKCEELGFKTTRDYFDPTADTEKNAGPHVLFLMRHVLEHIEDPSVFIEEMALSWSMYGAPLSIFVEVPNIVPALNNKRIEDWVYEHVQHFTPISLKRLFTSLGFTIVRCETTYNNEVILLHAYKSMAGADSNIIQRCEEFASTYDDSVAAAQVELLDITISGRSIAYWGGIGKGAMFLHQIALKPLRVVDSDMNKVGLCVPGLKTRIEHCTTLLTNPVDVIVVTTAWRADDIVAEIVRREIQCEKVLVYRKGELTEVPVGR